MEFHETVRGKVFFEHQLPELIGTLKRLADAIETSAGATKEKVINGCEREEYNCDKCCKNGDCIEQGMDGKPRWMEEEQ